jgi:hypothetical protein
LSELDLARERDAQRQTTPWWKSGMLIEVGVAAALVGIVVWNVTLQMAVSRKQDEIVIVDFERLSNLYTGMAIESGASGDALGDMTSRYLAAANAAADDFARNTDTIVILSAAVVGGEDEMTDVTDVIHARALASIGEQR